MIELNARLVRWRTQMSDEYSKYLCGVAERLRIFAERAPDIASELRRFAADIEQIAAEEVAPRRGDDSSDFRGLRS
jgi:hypothetical protein